MSTEITELSEYLCSRSTERAESITYKVLGIFFLLLISLSLLEIDIVKTFPAVLEPTRKVKILRTAEPGVISKIYIAEGDRVRKGDVIATLDATASGAEHESIKNRILIEKIKLRRIKSSISERPFRVSNQIPEEVKEHSVWMSEEGQFQDKVKAAEQEISVNRVRVKIAKSALEKSVAQLKNAAEQERLLSGSIGQAISKFSYMDYKDAKERLSNDVQHQKEEVALADLELQGAINNIASLKRSRLGSLLKEQSQGLETLKSLKVELTRSDKNVSTKKIIAVDSGVVDMLSITSEGQFVASAEIIAKIVPMNDALTIRSSIDSKDISFVKPGVTVKVKIEAYPYQIYGAMSGRVTRITEDSEEKRDARAAGTEQQIRMYIMHASIDAESRNQALNIRPGMAAEVDVVTARRSIISVIFDPLLKNINEGFR